MLVGLYHLHCYDPLEITSQCVGLPPDLWARPKCEPAGDPRVLYFSQASVWPKEHREVSELKTV